MGGVPRGWGGRGGGTGYRVKRWAPGHAHGKRRTRTLSLTCRRAFSRPHGPHRLALLSPAPKLHFRYTGAGRKRAGIGPIPRRASVAKQHCFRPRPPGARNLSPPGPSAAPLLAAGACVGVQRRVSVRSSPPRAGLDSPVGLKGLCLWLYSHSTIIIPSFHLFIG